MEGGLGWVIFHFNIVESKYVGCECIGCLGVIWGRSMFVDSYYGWYIDFLIGVGILAIPVWGRIVWC